MLAALYFIGHDTLISQPEIDSTGDVEMQNGVGKSRSFYPLFFKNRHGIKILATQ